MQFDFPFLAVLRDESCGLDMCILTDRDVYTRERIGVVSVPTGSVSGPQLSAAATDGESGAYAVTGAGAAANCSHGSRATAGDSSCSCSDPCGDPSSSL